MHNSTIVCPHCGKLIQLTEALTHDIEQRLTAQYEDSFRSKEKLLRDQFLKRERDLRDELTQEQQRIGQLERQHAREELQVELEHLHGELAEKARRLDEARRNEMNMLTIKRDLEEKERFLQLEVARAAERERNAAWEEASAKLAEEYRLKDSEKEKQLNDLRRQIEELKRKAEVGSQQLQGEVQELELEAILRRQFRTDRIEPVPKGTHGADLVQVVRDEQGGECGTIVWESKRTKAWSESWIQKLKDDQRAVKADIAVIVSAVLPKDVQRFAWYDGVWVSDVLSAVGLATVLRLQLMEISYARNAAQGKNEKVELIYSYLSGSEFAQRVQAIVEACRSISEDIQAERRAMERLWSKREKEVERIWKSSARMYGELRGIVGASLPGVKILELPTGDPTNGDIHA